MAAPTYAALSDELRVHGITKRWPGRAAPVLDGAGLALPGGTGAWVGGANGAGKTTLLRIVAGLLAPEAGTVRVGGVSLADDRVAYQRRIGFLSAGNSGLYARMTVRQHLAYWAPVAFVTRRARREAGERAVRAFALDDLAGARVDRLSMGQRQRVRLALCFLHDPSLLLLDEPRTSLDAQGAELLEHAIAAALSRGAAVVWCSPEPGEAPAAIRHRFVLAGGRLAPVLTPARLREYADGGAAVLRRDAILYFSYRTRFVGQAVVTFFSLVLFYYVSRLVRVGRFADPDDYFAYVVVGLMILQVMTATLATLPTGLRSELLAGTFERVVVSPLGPVAGIAAMTLFPTLSALAVGSLTVTMAAVVFGLDVAWATVGLAIPVGVLASLAFLPFALLVASLVLVSKQAGGLGGLIVIALSLAAGIYYPTTLMPEWIAWVGEAQPFSPALELLRHLIVDAPMTQAVAAAVAKLVGFTVVAAPLSWLALAAAVRLCMRQGTLIEY